MKNFFDDIILKSKIRIAVGIIIGITLLLLIFIGAKQQELSQGQIVLLIGVWLLIEIIQLINIEINAIFSWLIYLIAPYIAFLLLERFIHYPFNLEMPILILNTIIFFVFFLFLLFLTGNSKIGGIIGILVPMIFGIANYFVLQFRSSPIVPWDIYSTETALSVAANYKFEFSYYMVLSVILFTLLIVIMSKTSLRFKRIEVRAGLAIVSLVLFLVTANRTWDDEVKEELGLFVELFSPSKMQRLNGTAANFLMIFQYMSVEEPDNYSVQAVSDIIEELLADGEAASAETADEVMPNIIVIINEALSDLSVIGYIETNEDYFSFMNSMQENTIKGNVYVSVKGGNTANSEFEFLTGNTMAFLPSGSIPYQQFIHDETPSLVWQLKELGYNATAFHPFGSSGWNRYKVYPYLGFDASYFKESFIEPEYIRSYVSDREIYNRIIDLFENKEEGEKEFIFTVTMQNHGSYLNEYENFTSDIFPTNMKSTAELNQYLSLMKQSDIAFEELITYFSEQEEETIILMYGDHQPADSVVKPIYNANGMDSDNLTMEQSQDRYITPYIMWANYDIEEAAGEDTSANYLSLLLLKQAGIPLTKYQQALLKIGDTIPVITANAYRDNEGNFYNIGNGAYEEILNMYSILQYNMLIDTKNRLDNVFSLGN